MKKNNSNVKETKTRSLNIRKAVTPMVFLLPFVSLFCVFVVFPFIYGITISFFNWNMFDPAKRAFCGFDNYVKILFNEESIYYSYFWSGLKYTLLFVAISVPPLICISLLFAALLDKKPFGFRFFRFALFAPTVLSIATVIIIWSWQFYTNNGVINEIFTSIGLPKVDWLNKQPWAWVAILIITIWWTVGTNMVIFGAAMNNVDKNLYEAAQLDGASAVRQFFSITLPGIKNQLFMCIIMTMIASFNIYGQPQMLTSGGPVENGEFTTMVLMMRIRSIGMGANANPGVASAMSVCMGLTMIVLSLIQNRLTKEK